MFFYETKDLENYFTYDFNEWDDGESARRQMFQAWSLLQKKMSPPGILPEEFSSGR